MIRVQAQLTEGQARRLRLLAAEQGVSVAELLRRGADHVLTSAGAGDPDLLRERAMSVVGRHEGEATDVSRRHDEYLEEAFGK